VPIPVTMAQHPGEPTEGTVLIRRMAGGDREAFAAFYDRYSSLAFSMIRRILPQPAEAEEVLQEVFWQSWTEADRYDRRRGTPEAWVLMRCRSRAIDRLRVIRRRTETFVTSVDETLAQTPDGKTPSPGALAEDRKLLASALGGLPDPQRRVIELAFFEGLTQAEIAERLGEPLGTVKTRTRAGLERLRGHFTALESATT
jgi:RNA polymerase sigma-70 factor, ECF subfamily